MTQIPLSKSPSLPSPVVSKPSAQKIVNTFKGTKGIKKNHVIDVIDQNDKSQVYNFLDHCQTCGWEGRYDTLEEAIVGARIHVGLDQPAPSETKTHIRL